MKLKSENNNCFVPMPTASKKLFAGPFVPNKPKNAYALSNKLIHDGKIISKSHSCRCFVLISKYAVGYAINKVKKVIRNAYQKELNVIFKYTGVKNFT